MHEEAKIQSGIVRRLQSCGIFCHSVPNEGAGESRIKTMQMIAMGLRPGVADLVVWVPVHGCVVACYVEVKTAKGRLSEAQQRFRDRCHEAGVPWALVRSEADALDFVRSVQDGSYRA